MILQTILYFYFLQCAQAVDSIQRLLILKIVKFEISISTTFFYLPCLVLKLVFKNLDECFIQPTTNKEPSIPAYFMKKNNILFDILQTRKKSLLQVIRRYLFYWVMSERAVNQNGKIKARKMEFQTKENDRLNFRVSVLGDEISQKIGYLF